MADFVKITTPKFEPGHGSYMNVSAVGGYEISVASAKNRRSYNQDSAGVANFPGAADEKIELVADQIFAAAAQGAKGLSKKKTEGGTAITVGTYNPRTDVLAIRSAGDSPAYLVFYNKEHAVAMRITSPCDSAGANLINGLPALSDKPVEVHQLTTSIHPDPREWDYYSHTRDHHDRQVAGSIIRAKRASYPTDEEVPCCLLNEFIELASEAFQLGDPSQVGVALVACSDGLESGLKIRHAEVNDVFAKRIAKLMREGEQNIADVIVDDAEKTRNVSDNISAVVIPLRRLNEQGADIGVAGEKDPIAFAVGDGNGKNGHRYSGLVVDALSHVAQRVCGNVRPRECGRDGWAR